MAQDTPKVSATVRRPRRLHAKTGAVEAYQCRIAKFLGLCRSTVCKDAAAKRHDEEEAAAYLAELAAAGLR